MGESVLLSPVCLWLKAPQRGEITEKQITNPDCIVGNAVPEEEEYMDNISKHYLFSPSLLFVFTCTQISGVLL